MGSRAQIRVEGGIDTAGGEVRFHKRGYTNMPYVRTGFARGIAHAEFGVLARRAGRSARLCVGLFDEMLAPCVVSSRRPP